MSQFLSRLVLATGDDSGQWEVVVPLVYASDVANRIITVPSGFRTDLASTPRIPIIYEACGNIAAMPAVVHDYLYASGREPRDIADAVLREASAVVGVSWWQRWAMWAGVRIGGASHYTATPSEMIVPPAMSASLESLGV
jgi:hypothetical protein